MRRVLIATLVTAAATTATAKQEPPGAPIHYSTPYSDLSSGAANQAFINALQRKVEAAGYKDVDVEPRMFFVTAVDASGRPVALMVDADAETTVEIPDRDELNLLSCNKADR